MSSLEPISKKQQVTELIKAGDYPAAIKIAAKFFDGFTKDELRIIVRAHEMGWSPLYAQMGFKQAAEIEKAVAIIRTKWGF